jgi:hypothetical protein
VLICAQLLSESCRVGAQLLGSAKSCQKIEGIQKEGLRGRLSLETIKQAPKFLSRAIELIRSSAGLSVIWSSLDLWPSLESMTSLNN